MALSADEPWPASIAMASMLWMIGVAGRILVALRTGCQLRVRGWIEAHRLGVAITPVQLVGPSTVPAHD